MKKFQVLTTSAPSEWRRYLIQHPQANVPNEMGDLILTNIPQMDVKNFEKINRAVYEQPGTMVAIMYMCNPDARAAFWYLLNHRRAIINACMRSESKTLHNFARVAEVWHKREEARVNEIISRSQSK